MNSGSEVLTFGNIGRPGENDWTNQELQLQPARMEAARTSADTAANHQ